MVKNCFSSRDVTLILYKAAELQDETWWLRSVPLAQRLPRYGREQYDLSEVEQIADEMGIEKSLVRAAAEMVGLGREWDAT